MNLAEAHEVLSMLLDALRKIQLVPDFLEILAQEGLEKAYDGAVGLSAAITGYFVLATKYFANQRQGILHMLMMKFTT